MGDGSFRLDGRNIYNSVVLIDCNYKIWIERMDFENLKVVGKLGKKIRIWSIIELEVS